MHISRLYRLQGARGHKLMSEGPACLAVHSFMKKVRDLGRQAHPSRGGLKGSMNVKPEGVMFTSGS